jgi:hypothetical protein
MDRPILEVDMFEMLVGANALQRPTPPSFADGDAEDRYYRSHEPRRLRLSMLAPLSAFIGLVVIALSVVPH